MQNRTSTLFWPRLGRVDDSRTTGSSPRPASSQTQQKIRSLVQGLFYVGLFWLALFLEVYVRTQTKSMSLEVWMLSHKKAAIESEMTRLDMRLTVLESPRRLEELASSEIGLMAVAPPKAPTDKSTHSKTH